jgi:hypothetical protein
VTTETLRDVVVGVKVVINGISDTLTDVVIVTLKLGTVATVTVVVFVGVGRDKQSQAVDRREHSKGKGAPALAPACGVMVIDVVDVVVGFLISGGSGKCKLRLTGAHMFTKEVL